MEQLTYAICESTGMVYSRHPHKGLAVPVYQFAEFGKDGDFTGEMPIKLEHFSPHEITSWWELEWTKKVPAAVKNKHRAFWGMPPLPEFELTGLSDEPVELPKGCTSTEAAALLRFEGMEPRHIAKRVGGEVYLKETKETPRLYPQIQAVAH